ncbi:MAG: hypothetical protein V3G42_13100 [Oscillospiraceae bacterium]
MSKEVELTGIQMTASVPENLQISLGKGTNGTKLDATFTATSGSRSLVVTTPDVSSTTTDWVNSVVLSDYYTFGRLTPATSIDGNAIYFTKDATAAGRRLLQDTYDANTKALTGNSYAAFTKADTGAVASGSQYLGTIGVNDAKGTSKGSGTTDADKTGGGYYIDVPVWFRTSIVGTGNVELAVKATITAKKNGSGTAGDSVLYNAARCALLKDGTTSVGAIMNSGTYYYHTGSGTVATGSGAAPSAASTINDVNTNSAVPTWASVDPVAQVTTITDGIADGSAEKVVEVPKASTEGDFGSAQKYILRVWLEGEDVNCWDETAAQDFQIDLQFVRKS